MRSLVEGVTAPPSLDLGELSGDDEALGGREGLDRAALRIEAEAGAACRPVLTRSTSWRFASGKLERAPQQFEVV
jgi:hypothetical protein